MVEDKLTRMIGTGALVFSAAVGLEGSVGRVSAENNPQTNSPQTLPEPELYPSSARVEVTLTDGTRVFCDVNEPTGLMYPGDSLMPAGPTKCDSDYPTNLIKTITINGVKAICKGPTVEPANPVNCKKTPSRVLRGWWKAGTPWEMQINRQLNKIARASARP